MAMSLGALATPGALQEKTGLVSQDTKEEIQESEENVVTATEADMDGLRGHGGGGRGGFFVRC